MSKIEGVVPRRLPKQDWFHALGRNLQLCSSAESGLIIRGEWTEGGDVYPSLSVVRTVKK
jgi:hypothetical protein